MVIYYGNGPTKYGPGVNIELTGDDVALAIMSYLTAHGVHYTGPATITVNGELCKTGNVYVDPSGDVIHKDRRWSGRGDDRFCNTTEFNFLNKKEG